MGSRWLVCGLVVLWLGGGCGGSAPASLKLERVVLFQNGIGYFERQGDVQGSAVRMQFAPHEIDDVLKTVTVIDENAASVAHVEVEDPPGKSVKQVPVTVHLSSSGHHRLHVSYAVPTPTWKASYRLVLDDARAPASAASAEARGLLQGWATVNNTSGEDWQRVRLTLVTGAPFSYAMDLKSPIYISRPDVNGVMVSPVTAVVEAEVAGGGAADSDGDGVKDADDLCPKAPEDLDGYEDADGCPDLDNDRDRIPDASDLCPNEPETYNGIEDDDGCPDRGRVVVTDTAIEILDHIFFKKGSASIESTSLPILDALAQTLLGNPAISAVEVQGHASDEEGKAWELSSERAVAVILALRQRGVEGQRLVMQGYGNTQLLDPNSTERARAKNRRVSFLILRRDDGSSAEPKSGAITTDRVAQSAPRSSITSYAVAGASRYELRQALTIPRGGATMVSIINQPVDAEDIYLFRPDSGARGSEQHPFRAIRLHNSTKLTLQPGALAVFAQRTYVGDSLLSSLAPGHTTFAPYALDKSVAVRVERTSDSVPLRIVSASKGWITLEVARRHLTRYEVSPSDSPPARIFLHHAKAIGYRVEGIAPGSVDQGDSWLVAVPLAPAKSSSIVVEERAVERLPFDLMASQLPDLTAYLAASQLPDVAATGLRAAMAQRAELRKLDDELEELRTRQREVLDRTTEARASLAALGTSAEGAALRKKLVADLATTTTAMNELNRDLAQKMRERVAAETKLRELVRQLLIAEKK